MSTRGPYIRSDAARTRGRVLSLLFGGIFGLWVGAKIIPYQLITRNPDPEPNENGQRPFLRMRVEDTKPLELKPQYKEELHRREVERIIAEMKEKQRLEGAEQNEKSALRGDASRQSDAVITGLSSTTGLTKPTETNTEESKMQSTIGWIKSKFNRGD
ncbi:hypothetical protein V1517DRAFT_346078 [Lipomyces orientalis]|uniref:Uncharacterized protein n=1 Tax=Lipomyces orientalis TaxID=1233043 RepID=A0ACC3TRG3_9ASCO